VDGLGKGDEDGGNPQLFVGEELDDIGVEAQNAEFVESHDAGEQLHDENFVVKGETLVVCVERIEELLAERLGIMEKL